MTALSPLAQSLIEAGVSALNDNGPGFIVHIKSHDWASAAVDVVAIELELAAAAGVPGAGLALKLLPVAVYMGHHPADPSDPAMAKAAGPDNSVSLG